MFGMEAEEKWFWVWLSIFVVVLGTAPFAYWQGYHLSGIVCAITGLGGLFMLIRDHLAATASKWPIRVSLKALAVVALSMLVAQLIGRQIAGYRVNGGLSSAQWWLYGSTLLLIVVVVTATLSKSKPSKLVIHWANYRAVEDGGDVYQVGEFLQQIISGDSLVFDIENHNFKIGGKDFVPRDPLSFKEKRLQVNYSYGGEGARTTERREHGRLLLPEDSKIKWLMGEVDRLKAAQQGPAKDFDQGRRFPRNVFTVQRVTADPPSINPGVFYKDKIRVILTNHLDRTVFVWTPMWQSLEVQCHQPLGSLLRLEGLKGWKADDWVPEEESLSVPVGVTFSCWIGLLPPIGESIERRLQTHTSIGTATFPVKIDGKLYEVPINL
jgi:hypothetical protein